MKGRNLDYGSQKSNSKEGEMAKRTLITMAKDLYDLYINLNDHDDLPEWCHYKLARSQNELEAVSNYLTSKIYKHCLDNNISFMALKEEVKNSFENERISEGIFDYFKNRKTKKELLKIKKYFRQLMTSRSSMGEYAGFIQFVKDCNKLVNLIDSHGMFREKKYSKTYDYEFMQSSDTQERESYSHDYHIRNLEFISSKLLASVKVLESLARPTKSFKVKKESYIKESLPRITSRKNTRSEQKELAFKIVDGIRNKSYSSMYYDKPGQKPHSYGQKRKLIDLISIELSSILSSGNFKRIHKAELASIFHDHVKSISDKLINLLEKEKELDENI